MRGAGGGAGGGAGAGLGTGGAGGLTQICLRVFRELWMVTMVSRRQLGRGVR